MIWLGRWFEACNKWRSLLCASANWILSFFAYYYFGMLRKILISCTVGLCLAGSSPVSSAAASSGDPIGSGKNTCVPGPSAKCSDVVHKWKFEHHGDLRGANFSKAKLHGADLRGARLDKANFRGAVLRHAHFHDASLVGADFSKAIRPKKLVKLCAVDCEEAGADLSNANLSGADLSKANLTGATLNYADLSGANLTLTDLTNADVNYANLTNANLSGVIASDAELWGSDFTGANLGPASNPCPQKNCAPYLTPAYLNNATLSFAIFVNAYMKYADLSYSAVNGANLTGANLDQAYLAHADLTGANLTNANLSGADLTGANLTNANLSGANLSGATMPDGTKNSF